MLTIQVFTGLPDCNIVQSVVIMLETLKNYDHQKFGCLAIEGGRGGAVVMKSLFEIF